jgi:hypothetical protein
MKSMLLSTWNKLTTEEKADFADQDGITIEKVQAVLDARMRNVHPIVDIYNVPVSKERLAAGSRSHMAQMMHEQLEQENRLEGKIDALEIADQDGTLRGDQIVELDRLRGILESTRRNIVSMGNERAW